jgi:hypothetical protein
MQTDLQIAVIEKQYRKVEPLRTKVIDVLSATLGPDHPELAGAFSAWLTLTLARLDLTMPCSLTGIQCERHQYGEAERLYRRAVGIMETTLGPEHAEVLMALSNLTCHSCRNATAG